MPKQAEKTADLNDVQSSVDEVKEALLEIKSSFLEKIEALEKSFRSKIGEKNGNP